MKKIVFTLLITILSLPVMVNAVVAGYGAKDNVNVYVFSNDECKSCDETIQYVEDLKKENFLVVVHEMKISENQELLDKVEESLKIKSKKLPLVIVGTNSFNGNKKELNKGIQAYLDKETHCDLVATIQGNGDIDKCIQENDGIYKQPKGFPVFVYISVVVIVAVIMTFVLMMVIQKNKRKKKINDNVKDN